MRPIDADRLLTERMKSKYYHLPNGDIAIPIIDIEHAPTIDTDRQKETSLKEAEVLLKATRNLLDKQNETIYVLNILEETVEYYGVECDGSCLIEDIDDWLELYGSEEGADDEVD